MYLIIVYSSGDRSPTTALLNMLENFENFESNVLDCTQVGLTWLFQ